MLSGSPDVSRPTTPRRFSQAAWFRAGSAPTRSRIMFQAARLRAPSGGGPMARETEHCGQKQMRCADDFCRGLIPTVCEHVYRDGFVADFDLPVAAKTKQVFQDSL